MIEKRKVLEACIKAQKKRIEDLKQSLERTQQSVREAPSSRQTWSDTSRFQLGSIAFETQRQVEEAKIALSQLRMLSVDINVKNIISVGALFTLKDIDTGEVSRYLLISEGGGDSFDIEGEEIMFISVEAPLAKVLLSKKKSDKVIFRDKDLEVVEVQ